MEYASIIKEIGRGTKGARALSREQACELFGHILDGNVPDLELGAILMALRIKGETADELSGFLDALETRTTKLSPPPGPRCVLIPAYNGARKQPNLMPLVALLLAREDIPVLIHGRHDFASRLDPFALLAELGIPSSTTPAEIHAGLRKSNPVAVTLAALSPGLDCLLALKIPLGVRNCGHTLAKLIDPFEGHSVLVVPVTHPPFLESMASLLGARHARALLMRGTEGEAYAAPRRRPRLLGFVDGLATEIYPPAEFDTVETTAGSTGENAALIRRMLDGLLPIPQPILDQVTALKTLAQN